MSISVAPLDAVREAITRYVVLPTPEAVDAVALWIAATHAQPAWAHAPRLVIRAPEKRCGKSRLLDIVEGISHAPLITVNATPAAVYRAIGTDDPPTLLVDEADTIFGGKSADANEDLRGLLNAGHQRNRPAIRWDSNTRTLEKIPTFAMAALAGIGAMPDTIEDRAVVVRMRRRAPGETVAPYRHRRDGPILGRLRRQLSEWLRGHLAELERAEPPMPIEDRDADTWEPLVAVADLAGGGWPERARHAALSLIAEADGNAQMSARIRLLVDIRAVFDRLGQPAAVATVELLDALNTDDEAPWSGYGPNGLTGKRLGDLLREFAIGSANVRFAAGQAKGYARNAFTDAWLRYCPAPPVPTVPRSSSPLGAGTDAPAGTDRNVPTHRNVPGLSRPDEVGTPVTDSAVDRCSVSSNAPQTGRP